MLLKQISALAASSQSSERLMTMTQLNNGACNVTTFIGALASSSRVNGMSGGVDRQSTTVTPSVSADRHCSWCSCLWSMVLLSVSTE